MKLPPSLLLPAVTGVGGEERIFSGNKDGRSGPRAKRVNIAGVRGPNAAQGWAIYSFYNHSSLSRILGEEEGPFFLGGVGWEWRNWEAISSSFFFLLSFPSLAFLICLAASPLPTGERGRRGWVGLGLVRSIFFFSRLVLSSLPSCFLSLSLSLSLSVDVMMI